MDSQAIFYHRTKEWLEHLMEFDPVLATQLGDHRWDHRLGDLAPGALEKHQQQLGLS